MTRVLFLDMDGVLHNGRSMMLGRFGYHPPGRMGKTRCVDQVCVRLLQEVVQDLHLHIVVSSTWRIFPWESRTRNSVHKALQWSGWRNPPIIGRTPGGGGYRGPQIDQWLAANPAVDAYVVLDDEATGMQPHHLDRLVQPEYFTGLTEDHCSQIRSLFTSGAANVCC